MTFLFILHNCSGFKPLYRENLSSIYKLQEFSIVVDEKKISKKIKQKLIELFPNNKKTKYIVKIEGLSDTSGTVADATRKISRYNTKVSAKVKLYYRYEKYDKVIYKFEASRDASYSLILNNIRSTLASKKRAEEISVRLLSEEIYKRILIFLSNN
ncbi:MAG: hypothetical protein CBC22_03090 [Alphaproteobacteria bacterium TMED62]|nr:MAG: hypothetical protein CBC22_03090 [Alphaproteobacteria bacterium TMED62]|tara:strand:+ start:8693 stop:9160 length:468 start_codon:yes stop_codon:yes gene_type:complete